MGITLIKVSVVYLIISIVLAMYMSITEIMTLSTVHSHTGCSWILLALSGLFYHLFPNLEKTPLSKVFFWSVNIGLPILLLGVAIYLYDQSGWVKVVISVGAFPVSIGIVLFGINVLTGLRNGI